MSPYIHPAPGTECLTTTIIENRKNDEHSYIINIKASTYISELNYCCIILLSSMESLQHVRTKHNVEASIAKNSGGCKLITQSNDIHGDGNFLQGCSFSPDGLCILTHTVADAKLRLYNTPLQSSINNPDTGTTSGERDWTAILSSDCGQSVRCYEWYPQMKSSDPGTCCFIASSRYVHQ